MKNIPRRFALLPELATRSRMEMRQPGLRRRLDRLRVHESDHQYFTGFMMLDDSAEPALIIEFRKKLRTALTLDGLI